MCGQKSCERPLQCSFSAIFLSCYVSHAAILSFLYILFSHSREVGSLATLYPIDHHPTDHPPSTASEIRITAGSLSDTQLSCSLTLTLFRLRTLGQKHLKVPPFPCCLILHVRALNVLPCYCFHTFISLLVFWEGKRALTTSTPWVVSVKVGAHPGFSVSPSFCIKPWAFNSEHLCQKHISLKGTSFSLCLTAVNSSESATKASCPKDPNIAHRGPWNSPAAHTWYNPLSLKASLFVLSQIWASSLLSWTQHTAHSVTAAFAYLVSLRLILRMHSLEKQQCYCSAGLQLICLCSAFFLSQMFCLSEPHCFKRSMSGSNQSRESSRDAFCLLQSSHYSTERSTWLTFMLGYLMQLF